MVKNAGLKARNVIKKRLKHRYFPVNFTYFFPKTLFTEHFWMIASPDPSAAAKVLLHFYDYTFLVFFFIFLARVGVAGDIILSKNGNANLIL